MDEQHAGQVLEDAEDLRQRLWDAEEGLRAIRNGEVDALVVPGPDGRERIYALRSADHPYRVLVEQMREGAVIVAADHSILYANPRLAEMLKMPLDRLLARPLERFIATEQRGSLVQLLNRCRAQCDRGEFTAVAADGTEIPVYLSGSAFGSEGHGGICIVATDLTEQKRTAELAAANAARDTFLSHLSHELRNPLTPVSMIVDDLESHCQSPEMAEDLAMLRRNVQHIVSLINDLLDVTRIARGKLAMQFGPVRVHDVLRHVVQAVRDGVAGEKSLVLQPDLAAGCDTVRADATRLRQVFWNLLGNAAKFTPAGGTVRVRTYLREGDDAGAGAGAGEGGRLVIEVRDSGIGIAPDRLSRLFDAFEQGDASITRRYGGLGLGLTIARGIVQEHGGTLRAASDGPGQGSTFTVELPVVRAG